MKGSRQIEHSYGGRLTCGEVAVLVSGVVLLLAGVGPAWALITAPTPLGGVLNESQYIFTVTVESVEPDRPGMVLAVDDVLKGKPPFKKLAVNLTGDADSVKKKETPELLKRVAPKLPLVVFVNQNDKNFTAFAFGNGTWFQMAGERADDGDVLRLPFTHIEPYLRRTFKGTTAEMKRVVADGLSGKAEPPAPNLKEKPGVGPEVEAPDKPKEKDKEESSYTLYRRGAGAGVRRHPDVRGGAAGPAGDAVPGGLRRADVGAEALDDGADGAQPQQHAAFSTKPLRRLPHYFVVGHADGAVASDVAGDAGRGAVGVAETRTVALRLRCAARAGPRTVAVSAGFERVHLEPADGGAS